MALVTYASSDDEEDNIQAQPKVGFGQYAFSRLTMC